MLLQQTVISEIYIEMSSFNYKNNSNDEPNEPKQHSNFKANSLSLLFQICLLKICNFKFILINLIKMHRTNLGIYDNFDEVSILPSSKSIYTWPMILLTF